MRNYRAFLKSIEGLSNRGMIKACTEVGLKKLGTGSTRVVFELTPKLVIKIALGKAGEDQNQNEIQYWTMLDYDFPGLKQYFAKVHINDSHWHDYFIVMDKLEKKFTDKRKYSSTILGIHNGYPTPASQIIKRAERLYKAVQTVDVIVDGLNYKDIHGGNIGIDSNGLVKMMDYGLTRRTHREHYTRQGAVRCQPPKHFLKAVS